MTAPDRHALVVAALAEEVAAVPSGIEVLVTGAGKIRAAAELASRLSVGARPAVVVNIGTAGAVDAAVSGVVEIGYVTEHDFPHEAIESLLGIRLPRGYLLRRDEPPAPADAPPAGVAAIATGDVFVADAEQARRIAATGIHLVDMESHAYAAVCARFAVPFRCVKVVSDTADADAGESWLDTIESCARRLGDWVTSELLD